MDGCFSSCYIHFALDLKQQWGNAIRKLPTKLKTLEVIAHEGDEEKALRN